MREVDQARAEPLLQLLRRGVAIFVVIPHVGKSHLTYRTVASIPDEHRIILIDGSFVRDMSMLASLRSNIDYHQTGGEPYCLAKNWNLGASLVPKDEPYWIFCASDIEFTEMSWRRIKVLEQRFPDCGIIKDGPTNWNVWLVRRWAWDLLKPMDERYKPCGGEDDDLVMKCQMAGIKIREGPLGLLHAEGGHATRLDIGDEHRGTTWKIRRENIAIFRRKWGCIPSKGKDPIYKKAIQDTHVRARRSGPPETFTIPTVRPDYPEDTAVKWPDPLKINLGCGTKPMKGFLNVDLQVNSADFLMDVGSKDPWPWDENSAERIESYHVIEHLTFEAGRRMVERSYATLKPGGVLVIECPDLEALCAKYPRSRRHTRNSIFGMSRWGAHMAHQYGYCGPTLKLLLDQVGEWQDIKIGPGTDYHQKLESCVRAEAVK